MITTTKTIRSDCTDAELNAAVATARGGEIRHTDIYGAIMVKFTDEWLPLRPYATSLDAIVPVVEARREYFIIERAMQECETTFSWTVGLRGECFYGTSLPRLLCLAYLKACGWTVMNIT